MDSQTDFRTAPERRQSSGDGLTGKPEKKRSTSLDERTINQHLSLKSSLCEWEVNKPAKVALDDCSLYVTPKSEQRRRLVCNGTKSFDAMAAVRKPSDKPRCICHLLLREKSQELKPCYDLVASPGPRFLLRSLDLADSPTASFKIPASVPFKWEEAPGKPRPDAAISKPDRSLQLPPRLLIKSSTGDCPLPDRPRRHQRRSFSQIRGIRSSSMECSRERPMFCTPLIFRSAELSASERKPKSVFSSCETYSPRSILSGPILNSASSSSDPNSMSDSETSTLAAPLLEIWSDLATQAENASFLESETPISHPEMQLIPYVESNLKDLAPSPEPEPVRSGNPLFQGVKAVVKFLSTSKSRLQRGRQKHKAGGFSEAELWAPTLATYFQFLERNKSNTMSEKLLLLDKIEAERKTAFEKRSQDLFSPSIPDNTASSLSPECTCQCKSWKEQTRHLPEQSAKNDASIFKQSHVNPFEKESINAELPDRFIGREYESCSPSRLFLLSPARIVPMKWGTRRMNLHSRDGRKIHRSPRSFNVLVNAIKHAFISKKQDNRKPNVQSSLLYGCVQG